MKILAVDTSAICASVAVTENGKILSESSINTGLTHSRTLMPMIDSVLKNAEIDLDDIDYLACSVGPGSFTGIRIGVAAIKGLSDATGKKCVAVSTLHALAYNLTGRNCTAVCAMDARCNQVYCAIFKIEGEKIERLTDDMALKIDELSEMLPQYENVIFVGDGAKLCHSKLGYSVASENCVYQKGSSVCFAASELLESTAPIDAKDLMPTYLRLPQAERELKARAK